MEGKQMKNKYTKIYEIDKQIAGLKSFKKDVIMGSDYTSGALVGTSDFYMKATIKVQRDWGNYTYGNNTLEYNILGGIVVSMIDRDINELKEKRIKIINPWYKRLFFNHK